MANFQTGMIFKVAKFIKEAVDLKSEINENQLNSYCHLLKVLVLNYQNMLILTKLNFTTDLTEAILEDQLH